MDKATLAKKIKECVANRKAVCPYCGSEHVTVHIGWAACRTCGRKATAQELKEIVEKYG